MPKLHDTCQLLAQEILSLAQQLPNADTDQTVQAILQAVETDIAQRRDDSQVICQHLSLVMSEFLEDRGSGWQVSHYATETAATLPQLVSQAVLLANQLFPTTINSLKKSLH